MKFDHKIKSLLVLFLLAAALMPATAQNSKALIYRQRADSMYTRIWKYYRVQSQQYLFSENYLSSAKDSLGYLQGDKTKAKEVSFLWPYSGMFSATNAMLHLPVERKKYLPLLDSMAMGMETYRDVTRSPIGYQAYPSKFERSDRYYDDNGLVGIEYLEAYFNTENPLYLTKAKAVFKFIISGWNDTLGGGVTWLEGHKDQKPACSNGMAMLVALKLYKATKEPYYLNWGKKFYNWMHENLRDSAGAYWNDKKTADGKVNKTYWTYNTGSMIEAAALLYEFTKDKAYVKDAEISAKAIYRYYANKPHDPNLTLKVDLPWFLTVLFRGYEALYNVDGDYSYIAAIGKDLDYAWQHCSDQYGLLSKSWTTDAKDMAAPKWLLDEACIAELYARLSLLESHRKPQ